MKKNRPTPRSDCPISYALDYLGDRWTLLILRDLLFFEKRRFVELAASKEKIASNILTARLKSLEAAGMVTRRPDPDNGRSVTYEPTDKAIDLIPALLELTHWTWKYEPRMDLRPKIARRIARDRDSLVRELAAKLRAPRAGG